MELFLPDQIVLNEVSSALLADVEETARRVNEYRPLPAEVVKRILDGLLGERVYSSNAIEGNTLDLRETVAVLTTGRLIENKKREAIEARNLGEATQKISELRDFGPASHTLEHLLETHKILLRETPDEPYGGRLRDHGVTITGAKYQPPDHTLVPPLIDRFLNRLREPGEVSGLLLACWAHWALARIHPFKDGNGRMARLWSDLVLFQQNLTCAVVRPEDRRDYLKALTTADEGDFNALFQMTAQRVLTTFDRYLSEIGQDRELDDFVKEIVGEAETRIGHNEQLVYQRWARRMEQLCWEFGLCGARVTQASTSVHVQATNGVVIDQDKWTNMRLGLSVEEPEFFRMVITVGKHERSFRFVFRRFGVGVEGSLSLDPLPAVSLVGMEHPAHSDPASPYSTTVNDSQTQPPPPQTLSRRYIEVVVVEGGFTAIYYDPRRQPILSEPSITPLRVAQDFIRDVVLRRMT